MQSRPLKTAIRHGIHRRVKPVAVRKPSPIRRLHHLHRLHQHPHRRAAGWARRIQCNRLYNHAHTLPIRTSTTQLQPPRTRQRINVHAPPPVDLRRTVIQNGITRGGAKLSAVEYSKPHVRRRVVPTRLLSMTREGARRSLRSSPPRPLHHNHHPLQ